jgi:protein involved in polysaccharide export with SLBB domain
MSKKFFCHFCFGLLCIFYLQTYSYSQNPEPTATPAAETEKQNSSSTPERLIHFGDVLDVDIIGSTEYDWRGRINPEGFLDGLDFIDEPIYALCRSEEAVAADIAKGYLKLLRDPKVSVTIVDRSGRPNSFLYGAVKTPHRFSLQREVRLNELIVLAGGLTDKASGEIQIIRPSNLNCGSNKESLAADEDQKAQKVSAVTNANSEAKTINIKIADLLKGVKDSNPIISNGDIITVLQSDPIYIIGGVLNPKQINVTGKMTVSRAIISAGGLAKSADAKNVTVFRRVAGETKVIQVNLEYIKAEKAEDIVLQKFDIVEVSQSGAEKRKFPPIIKVDENADKKSLEMPLRIIR